MKDAINAIREAFEALRPQIRPEGDAQAGALGVAINQAEAAAAAEPAPARPIDEQLAAIAAGVQDLEASVTTMREGVTALREAAGV